MEGQVCMESRTFKAEGLMIFWRLNIIAILKTEIVVAKKTPIVCIRRRMTIPFVTHTCSHFHALHQKVTLAHIAQILTTEIDR